MMLPKFVIVIDGNWYCGKGEQTSDPLRLPSPWSNRSFHTANNGVSELKFSRDFREAKEIEGRINLISHVKKVLDYVLSFDHTPDEIKIFKRHVSLPADPSLEEDQYWNPSYADSKEVE